MPPSSPTLSSHALRWPLLALGAVLAGCATTTPPPAPAQTPPVAMIIAVPVAPTVEVGPAEARGNDADIHHTPVALLLTQTDRVLKLPPAELANEIARLGDAEDATPETPLLLATALAQTRQAVDTARALGLVQRVLGNTSPAAQPLHPLARLLEARLTHQRRLEEQLERQGQQLREAQRRNDQLSERLEAVRAIERSLQTRPAPAAASPSAPAAGASSPGNGTKP